MTTNIVKLLFWVCVLCFSGVCLGGEDLKIFNALDFGAKADDKTDNARAFQDTWVAACSNSGPAMVLIPQGTYLLGPVKFPGPCKNAPSITMKIDAYLKAETDMNKYPTGDWIYFGRIDGLTVTGTGVFDGQGATIWHLNDCTKNEKCKLLPTNLKFISMTNTVINGITSLNSKNFHIGVVGCKNFKVTNLKIVAPSDSPNTDGMHVERSSDVIIQDTRIATGDDCISLGQGLSNVFITGVGCGPGHGISVGSLGKYPEEKDVRGIVVKDTTIIGTLNGVRIKSWPNSPSRSAVSNVTFENITMNNVNNPIIIDQLYCPGGSCPNQAPSQVKISDVSFKNIRGTYISAVGVTLHCSQGFPCQNVQLQEINLQYKGVKSPAQSKCLNIKPQYTGTQLPAPCAS